MTRNDHTDEPLSGSPATGHRHPHYEIRVRGHLAPRWMAWFDGMALTTEGPTTVLRGPLPDQAALHGVLQKLRDAGIPLLSLVEVDAPSTEGSDAPHPEGN